MDTFNSPEVFTVAFDKASYDHEYQKKQTTLFTVRLNLTHDADILAWLARQPNKQGAVKALIRADIEKNK